LPVSPVFYLSDHQLQGVSPPSITSCLSCLLSVRPSDPGCFPSLHNFLSLLSPICQTIRSRLSPRGDCYCSVPPAPGSDHAEEWEDLPPRRGRWESSVLLLSPGQSLGSCVSTGPQAAGSAH
ncbi:hypothetical protein J4Q44_G00347860, partial [Coregonus suidteri]